MTAYVIDTGIDAGHSEFAGRARPGFDAITAGGTADDCNGHGTHVAGTVGGATYGVAKQVSLVAVRVLNCSGSGSTLQVIAGVDWVIGNHQAWAPAVEHEPEQLGQPRHGQRRALVHRGRRDLRDRCRERERLRGRPGRCKYSPSRVTEAITVRATTSTDAKASFANYGRCVDWFAPGMGITSALNGPSNDETGTKSGTSMAAPHTAGVAALYLQGNTAASPTTVRDVLFAAATKGVVMSSSTANNHLLFTSC